jgi:hypothetical protein
MTFQGEDILVGLVALLLVPWIGWTMLRGAKNGRLPIGRAYVERDQRRGGYNALLALYGVALVAMAVFAVDLLFNLGLRNSL